MRAPSLGLLVLPVLLLAGCAAIDRSSSLAARVGDRVELTGRLAGPAKLGDFVQVQGERVFLRGPSLPAGGIAYGSTVRIRGRLAHDGGSDPHCDRGPECIAAAVPAHFYIDGASVAVVQP